jgi:hypothetical protein
MSGTPYQIVYNTFLGKISDYSFPNMTDATLTSTMHNYLISACVKFKHCRQDLTQRDDTNATFLITLTDEETEILSMNMVLEWMNSKVLDDKLLKPTLTDKDYNVYSQANQLREVRSAREALKREVKQLIKDYVQSDPSDLIGQLNNENSNANTEGIVNGTPAARDIGWEGY